MSKNISAIQSFSGREQEVFELLLRGMLNREIASSLGICEKTVEEHLISMYKKMGIKTRTQAILLWISKGEGFPSLTQKRIWRE
jgi:DNA-binding NarL/FixJ family response regulator